MKFENYIVEQTQKTLIALTQMRKPKIEKTYKYLEDACKKHKINFVFINTPDWYVDDAIFKNKVILKNYTTNETIKIIPSNTTVLSKRMDNLEGNAIKKILQESNCHMINKDSISGNKYENYLIFKKHNILSPATMLINNKTEDDVISSKNDKAIAMILDYFDNKFPLMLKTIPGSRGVGVTMIESGKTLKSTLQTIWQLGGNILLQEYLPIEFDIRCTWLGDEAVLGIKRLKVKNDVRSNYSQGAKISRYDLNDKEKQIVKKVCNILKLEWAGVDLAIVGNKHYILEVNTSSDMDFVLDGTDLGIADMFVNYIKMGGKHGNRE
jgi:RimK family alpha-L-glutamate ligase